MNINHISKPTPEQVKELWAKISPPAPEYEGFGLYVTVFIPSNRTLIDEAVDWHQIYAFDHVKPGWYRYDGWVIGMGSRFGMRDVESAEFVEDVHLSWVYDVSLMPREKAKA